MSEKFVASSLWSQTKRCPERDTLAQLWLEPQALGTSMKLGGGDTLHYPGSSSFSNACLDGGTFLETDGELKVCLVVGKINRKDTIGAVP